MQAHFKVTVRNLQMLLYNTSTLQSCNKEHSYALIQCKQVIPSQMLAVTISRITVVTWPSSCTPLDSFSGLPRPSHYPVFAAFKNREGRPGPFYHVNDVSVYLGRQRGGDPPSKEWACGLILWFLLQLCEVWMFAKRKMYCSWFKTKKVYTKCVLSICLLMSFTW